MLELYHFHGATCGLKARLAVAEKQANVVERVVERPYLKTAEYLALNPNGVVPTLVHDGTVLTESTVIINYLDDAFEEHSLKPGTAVGAARTLWWMKRADDCLQYIGILTYTVSLRHELSPDALRAYRDTSPDPAVRARRARILDLGYDNPDFLAAAANLRAMLDDMEAALARLAWLADGAYTLADVAITPLVERLDELAFAGAWEQGRPGVSAWWERVRARPSYQACVLQRPNPSAAQHRRYGEETWPKLRHAFLE